MQHTKGTRNYVKECRLSVAVHHIQSNISKKQPWKTATKRQDETSSDSVKREESTEAIITEWIEALKNAGKPQINKLSGKILSCLSVNSTS